MNAKKHAAEPWTKHFEGPDEFWFSNGYQEIRDATGDPICVFDPYQDGSAKRVVVCVNACQGIEHPEAISELIQAAKNFVDKFDDQAKRGQKFAAVLVMARLRTKEALAALGTTKQPESAEGAG